MTFWPVQIGQPGKTINQNLRSFQQNQTSYVYPSQISWENNQNGGCTAGCWNTFSEQLVGIKLSVSFNYDTNNNLTGANVTWAKDPTASFIGPNPPATVGTAGYLPGTGGLPPAPEVTRVDINREALKGLSPARLQALQKAAVNLPVAAIRQALNQAISQEQQRREKERKKCDSQQSGSCSN